MTPAGERRLCAEYKITSGRRGLYAQRIGGQIALTDAPLHTTDGDGRVYLVERHVASLAELDGLCRAYVEDSRTANLPGVVASRRRLADLANPDR